MELIDNEVYNFYNDNKCFEHNNHIKKVPTELSKWRNNKDITLKFYDWIRSDSGFASFPLNITVPNEEILKEAITYQDLCVPHRNSGNHKGWSSMTIHGTAVEHSYPRDKYFPKENMPEYNWTELAPKCPITKDWLLSLEFRNFERVRFMKLDYNGYIKPHSDKSRTKKVSIAWNVAINNPEGHKFTMKNEGLIPWRAGEIRALDVSIEHSVFNTSNTPRFHMIIHGTPGDKFIHFFCESYEILLQSKIDNNNV